MLSSYVCVCLCVYAAFVDARKAVEIETSYYFKLRGMRPDKPVRVLHKSDYKFQDGGQNGGREIL